MLRRALCVGINNYHTSPLFACIRDAHAVSDAIARNGDGSPNFEVQVKENVGSREELAKLIADLFDDEVDDALFYFSGHGYEDEHGSYLVTPEIAKFNQGYPVEQLMKHANASKAKNRIIILDCCFAGAAGIMKLLNTHVSIIANGVTLLCASTSGKPSYEVSGRGVFTGLLLEALDGGAADVCGNITAGAIYAYIDKALGAWDQRPVFKTSIMQFAPLKLVKPRIDSSILRRITQLFPTVESVHQLDPSYEETNAPAVEHRIIDPNAVPVNVAKFKDLQKLYGAGLVVPEGTEHMYFAAMESKTCRLTAWGRQYWDLVNKGRL